MKQCLACNETFLSSNNNCPECGFQCEIQDGFCAYAPAFAIEGSGFKSTYFSELVSLEDRNFWFRARNRLIIWALDRYCPQFQSLLEIGCGTGYVLSGITKAFPDAHLHGSELFTKGLSFAASRLPSVNLMQMDARNIPFVAEFDSIGAFDVLEHIEDDRKVLSQIHKALKPKGIVILTVPQHNWLWSPVDEYACHVRRYSAFDLHTKLKESGFEIIRSTSFVTTLLPAMVISRFIQKFSVSKKTINPNAELNISSWLNFIFEKMLNMEIGLIRWGLNFSLGGSRLVIARKVGVL